MTTVSGKSTAAQTYIDDRFEEVLRSSALEQYDNIEFLTLPFWVQKEKQQNLLHTQKAIKSITNIQH